MAAHRNPTQDQWSQRSSKSDNCLAAGVIIHDHCQRALDVHKTSNNSKDSGDAGVKTNTSAAPREPAQDQVGQAKVALSGQRSRHTDWGGTDNSKHVLPTGSLGLCEPMMYTATLANIASTGSPSQSFERTSRLKVPIEALLTPKPVHRQRVAIATPGLEAMVVEESREEQDLHQPEFFQQSHHLATRQAGQSILCRRNMTTKACFLAKGIRILKNPCHLH